ncbi:type II toxin-antitoxin system VapC family toxin [Nonomuraea angiospora]|uniref:type II toxin-antitoxin system VapC family toxin n=1 Tax=Nonomuraea angiospora TaxID=46172 RepID=UPI0029BBD0D2|nr:type II toxin-antitoxin system VapC family toxin [Nonomuraea angiospora]MDX3104083.1 type II toxin-antitoxin system VapC family toxin [Nonomuraea angiospora]
MIIDSSAVIAILLKEPGHEALMERLAEAEFAGIGAPTLVEASMVLCARVGVIGRSLLGRFLTEGEITVVDLTEDHWQVALDAFLRYGKGRHPASLNFGDCLSYAVSKVSGLPLLCKGNDFPETDLDLVLKL